MAKAHSADPCRRFLLALLAGLKRFPKEDTHDSGFICTRGEANSCPQKTSAMLKK
jgi:hypothetical protein